jgi:GNAT superfamily N-acetyltransferase
MDLFRPLVTGRLPDGDLEAGVTLLERSALPGYGLILQFPLEYLPLIAVPFEIQSEVVLQIRQLNNERFEPIINVLVEQGTMPNGLPRFLIRSQSNPGEVAAAAGLNWRTPYFADIAVHSSPGLRRQGFGRSVLAAMVQHVLETGRTPLYHVDERNEASIQLAESVGFRDRGLRNVLVQAVRRGS